MSQGVHPSKHAIHNALGEAVRSIHVWARIVVFNEIVRASRAPILHVCHPSVRTSSSLEKCMGRWSTTSGYSMRLAVCWCASNPTAKATEYLRVHTQSWRLTLFTLALWSTCVRTYMLQQDSHDLAKSKYNDHLILPWLHNIDHNMRIGMTFVTPSSPPCVLLPLQCMNSRYINGSCSLVCSRIHCHDTVSVCCMFSEMWSHTTCVVCRSCSLRH